MAEDTFQFRVFSGRGLEIEATARSVSIPTETGEIGVQANHCDYVGLLGTGLAVYETNTDAAAKKCLVSGGIITFANNTLTLLADTVDNPESLDTTPLSQDVEVLKTELAGLSLFDPQWEVLSQKVARIEALRELAGSSAR